jgi:hypothetical protein
MAKIDISRIEGYESMTTEQKLAALEAFEYEDNASELERLKNTVSKANSEAAEWKRKHNALLDDDEKKRQEDAEKLEKAMQELEILKTEKAISEFTAQFLAIGYEEKLAKSTAAALHKGDMATMFKNHALFVADRDKVMKAELLKSTPTPPAGDGDKGLTKEDIQKMTLAEKQKFATENPDAYKQIYGGN